MHDTCSAFNCSARAATLVSFRHLPSGHNYRKALCSQATSSSQKNICQRVFKQMYLQIPQPHLQFKWNWNNLKLETQTLRIPAPRPTKEHPTPDCIQELQQLVAMPLPCDEEPDVAASCHEAFPKGSEKLLQRSSERYMASSSILTFYSAICCYLLSFCSQKQLHLLSCMVTEDGQPEEVNWGALP